MRIAFLTPKYKAYSEGWIWRDINLLKENVAYVGTLNYQVDKENENVTVINLGNQSRIERILNRFMPVNSNTNSVVERNIIHSNKKFKADRVLINFLTFAYQIKDFIFNYESQIYIHCHGFDVTWDLRSYEHPEEEKYKKEYIDFVKSISSKVTFIANSEETKNRLKSLPIPESNIVVKYFGVPLPKFDYNQKIVDGFNPIKLLFVGRFVDCKGPDLVIKACEEVWERGKNVELYMIGDGPLYITCQLLRERSKYKNRIHLLGAQSFDVVAKYMESSDIFTAHNCIGALTRQVEAFGVSLLEAMSYNLPVITGNSGGPNEIIEDGFSGYLVPPGDIKEHSERIIELCENFELRIKMGERGRKIIEERFTLEKEKEQYNKIFCLS